MSKCYGEMESPQRSPLPEITPLTFGSVSLWRRDSPTTHPDKTRRRVSSSDISMGPRGEFPRHRWSKLCLTRDFACLVEARITGGGVVGHSPDAASLPCSL